MKKFFSKKYLITSGLSLALVSFLNSPAHSFPNDLNTQLHFEIDVSVDIDVSSVTSLEYTLDNLNIPDFSGTGGFQDSIAHSANVGLIYQLGEENRAIITQEGSRNLAFLYQEGWNNYAEQIQRGNNNKAVAIQIGSSNSASQIQESDNNIAVIYQIGIGNYAEQYQGGQGGFRSTIIQEGNYNWARVYQY